MDGEGLIIDLPKLLVVDDDKDFTELFEEIGEMHGFEVTSLNDSTLFDDIFAQTNYDIVVIDLMMPGKDGIEILRHLAEIAATVKVFVMSGYDESVLDVAFALAKQHSLNIVRHIAKPFRVSEVAEYLVNALEHQSTPASYSTGASCPVYTVEQIANAIKNDEFCFFYQPQISLKTKQAAGLEALARWNHPELGLLNPAAFIDFIEKKELINALTFALVDRGLHDFAELRKKMGDITLSINIAASQLSNLKLPDILSEKVQSHGLNTDWIVIEVTESGVIADLKIALDILARFRIKGFKLSIDDFGTGTAMYEQLQRLPITELKIDKSFVMNCLADKKSRAIVEETISLANKLGVTTVAEGIESSEIEHFLQQLGCDHAQGYLYSKPVPLTAYF